MKGKKKKAREVQPKVVTLWMIRSPREIHPGLGFWWTKSGCTGHVKGNGYTVLRPIKVRIVPVATKKRGARR